MGCKTFSISTGFVGIISFDRTFTKKGIIFFVASSNAKIKPDGTLQILRDDRHPAPSPPPTKLDTNLVFNIPLPFELPKMSWNFKEPFARSDNISVSQPNGSIIPGTEILEDYPVPETDGLSINRSTNIATDDYHAKYEIKWV